MHTNLSTCKLEGENILIQCNNSGRSHSAFKFRQTARFRVMNLLHIHPGQWQCGSSWYCRPQPSPDFTQKGGDRSLSWPPILIQYGGGWLGPHPHRTHNATQSKWNLCVCEWECSHCMQATSKGLCWNLRPCVLCEWGLRPMASASPFVRQICKGVAEALGASQAFDTGRLQLAGAFHQQVRVQSETLAACRIVKFFSVLISYIWKSSSVSDKSARGRVGENFVNHHWPVSGANWNFEKKGNRMQNSTAGIEIQFWKHFG